MLLRPMPFTRAPSSVLIYPLKGLIRKTPMKTRRDRRHYDAIILVYEGNEALV